MPKDTPAPESKTPPRRMHRFGIFVNVALQLLMLFALFGIVNYLSYRHYERRDLSPNMDYTLSEATANYIRKLAKDVDLTVVFTRESPIMPDVHSLVDEFRQVKRSRVHTSEVDPVRDVERAEELKLKHGLTLKGNGILVQANGRNRFITEEEIIIKGLNKNRDNPSVDFRGEDAIMSAIMGLIEGEVRTFYYLVGKGDATGKGPEPAYTTLSNLGRAQNFNVSALNLTEVTTIPADASGVILVGPKYDLGEREIAMLQAYWEEKRASFLILLDPNGETPRLKQFLQSNGVIPRPDRVLYAESTSAGAKKQYSVETVFQQDSPISAPFSSVASSFSGQTQSLDLKTDSPELRAKQVTVTPLIDATERFWGETRYLMDLPVADEGDTKPPVHLAASIERGQVSDERLRVDSARMVVVGNALLLDPDTRLAVHQDFIAASLNWMMNRERLIGITPKRKQTFRLELANEHRQMIFWVTALLFPGAVLMLGMMVWSHRRV